MADWLFPTLLLRTGALQSPAVLFLYIPDMLQAPFLSMTCLHPSKRWVATAFGLVRQKSGWTLLEAML